MAIADLASDLARALDPVRLAEQAGIAPTTGRPTCCARRRPTRALAVQPPGRQIHHHEHPGRARGDLRAGLPRALLLSLTLRQSGELFNKAAAVYGAIGRPVPPESASRLQLELENRSRIVSLPGKEGTIRGYSGVRLLAIDEAAWVPGDLYLAQPDDGECQCSGAHRRARRDVQPRGTRADA
jgi:hypothetical protein